MPRRGRRSCAARLRFRKPTEEELGPSSATLQTIQMVSPPAGQSRMEPTPAPRWSRTTDTPPSVAPVSNVVGSSLPATQFWRRDDVRADSLARKGTGYRHQEKEWPISPVTKRSWNLVIPPESPDKKFVLIVGDSHLRAIVDGFSSLSSERFSFGFLACPGADACRLRTEVVNVSLPRIPEAVCLLAPSNNLTSSATIDRAAADYMKLLIAIRSRWFRVFVVDFPPRLNCEVSHQNLLRQEFHRVSARMGVKYFSAVEEFPLHESTLWIPDGVHLSDCEGMAKLCGLLCRSTEQEFAPAPPVPPLPCVSHKPSPPVRKFSPKTPAPRSHRVQACQRSKMSQPGGPLQSQGSAQTRMTRWQEKECFLPINPVWFSPEILQAMEEVSPSHLPSVVDCEPSQKHKRRTSKVSSRQRHTPDSVPQGHRSVLNNLVGSPSSTLCFTSGDESTPCSSPVAKMARIETLSPVGPSWTISDRGFDTPSPAKMARIKTPSPAEPSWTITDRGFDTPSPAKVRTSAGNAHVQAVKASHSQNDKRYKKFSRNHQCSCMSLTFLAYQNEDIQFNTRALDRVLAQGDLLYVGIKRQLIHDKQFRRDHLTVEEMPKQVLTDRNMYNVHMADVRCGPLFPKTGEHPNEQWGLPLATQLECLSADVSHALIIITPEVIAVFRERSGRYGVFDSHTRNAAGLPHHFGTAIMKTFSELSDLADHLHKLFQNRGRSATYEFVPVSFEAVGSSEHPEQSAAPNQESHAEIPPCPQSAEVLTAQMAEDIHIPSAVLQALPVPTKDTKSETAPCPQQAKVLTAQIIEDIDISSVISQTVLQTEKIFKVNKQRQQKAKRRASESKKQHASLSHEQTRKRKAQLEKSKYASCPEFKRRKIQAAKTKVTQDGHYHKQRLLSFKHYYADPTVQGRKKEELNRRYKTDPAFQSKRKQHITDKYRTDPAFRIKQKKVVTDKYRTDPAFRIKQKRVVTNKYRTDPAFRSKKKRVVTDKYRTDPAFRSKQKRVFTDKYRTDPAFRSKKKRVVTDKYRTDPAFRSKQKRVVTDKYRTDPAFRSKQKKNITTRYHNDPEFRLQCIQRICQRRKIKLATNAAFGTHYKLQKALRIRRKYRQLVTHHQRLVNPVMEAAIAAFRETIRHGPTYVCTSCNRAMFPNQVKVCRRAKYSKHTKMAATCLTGKYVHFCDTDCTSPCSVPQERLQEWICHTCDNHLSRGKMPSIAEANNLELAPIPPELASLNVLERQLIAKILPFSKIVSLPKGQQKAVRGAVVCVPSEVEATVNSLPRPRHEAQLLQVKLKRHIKYKGHQHFYNVNMKNVLAGLSKLKQLHSEYKDVSIDESATFESLQDESANAEDSQHNVADFTQPEQHNNPEVTDMDIDLEEVFASQNDPDQSNAAAEAEPSQQPKEAHKEKEDLRPGLALDTCMQPPDIAQEILSYGDGIFSIAPAQGNRPVGFFAIPKLEAMAFPVQFPTGQNSLDEARTVKLSPSMYFNARLFAADTRFASDQSYLFFAQFVTETHLATSSMSIQMRKGKSKGKDGRKINNKMLQDKDKLERLIQDRDVTRFMRPLRGTPAYWDKTLKDVNAMLRQIGKPTFFLTFSAAEMRWPEVIQVIKAQQGELGDFSELDWNAKCDILRSNPITVMRMFEKRVDALMNNLILSPAQPIGEVEDYFYRVEFQARGSPHIHMLVWIKNAPIFEDSFDRTVCSFIDKYITCNMPDPETDPELNKIVSEVQVHSRNHSKSCKKGNVACRFGFPKLPMDQTFITRPETNFEPPDADLDPAARAAKLKEHKQKIAKMQREAKTKLKPVRDLLMDPGTSFSSLSDLLQQCSMTYNEYLDCVISLTSSYVVMLKRDVNNCWVNNYNPDLLRAWNANMDIQYVVDEFSCAMYMMSYVSKPEHEMTDFLDSVIKEVKKSKVNERDEMKQIMQAYAKHREVSAQEAAARTCSLPLKKCSRSVVFLQTDEDGLKMSHPISRLQNMEPDSEDVWISGLPEKYFNRPKGRLFDAMCLAMFASEFRVVYGQQMEGKNVIALQNAKGFIQRRTVGKAAIIRFPRFSEKKNPEKFHRRLLKLYYPHRSDAELTCEEYPTYKEFYECAVSVRFSRNVRVIVDVNQKLFEGKGKKMDKAFQMFNPYGPKVLNAWNTFAPEVELDRLECVAECEPRETEHEESDDIPDYQVHNDGRGSMPTVDAPQLSPDFMIKMYQSLNEMQASIFYSMRQWCFQRVWGHDPEPFYYFMSGGAGCGKSHVIKCIHQEATRILRELPRFRDQGDMSQPAVLLTAFTGTAAFNISGKTLHSILKLPRSLKPPYQGLGNALDEVRATLSNAEILIIDEISMVSKELFAYVHWRLQQIKGNKKPFGGMSVLAVGDFYQLPPLGKAKPLCVYEETEFDLWKDHFTMVNLTEIMRQKDDLVFAELLNRLRVKRKEDPLSNEDRELLTQAVVDIKDCPADWLHIYATNKEVDHHNASTVAALHEDIVDIAAHDFRKDPATGCMMVLSENIKGSKRDLPDKIMAAQGVRVMLIRNLDVEDGIVNGTFGTISNIVMTERDSKAVRLIGLQLDNPTAGQKFRKKILGPSDNLVYIERSEENTSRKGVIRRQFPMKLAFACTAHKVQGMTMTSAVVCLKRVFEPGMAYVALSRTTSLQGLAITDFEEKKIYADPAVKTALETMNHASFQSARPLLTLYKSMDKTLKSLTIIHHNTQGLPSHIVDLKAHHELRLADVLCVTETHLSGSSVSPVFHLEGYNMFTRSRQLSYNTCLNMARKDGGGVAVYCRSNVEAQPRRYMHNVTDLEFVVVKIEAPVKVLIATVYKPQSFHQQHFLLNMKNLLDALHMLDNQPIIICGDFNEDLLGKGAKSVIDLFQSRGYTQLITESTTEKNTLIDHIYISHPDKCLQSGVLQTYYSYHSPVYCILTE